MKYLFLLAIILSIISCDSTEPPVDDLQPGSRDYTWEADTIFLPFISLGRIWGNRNNNVWIVGSGGDFDKTIYHFDGDKWYTDGISRPISPSAVWGFSDTDIWIAGIGGIFNYNGAEWHKIYEYSKDDFFIVGIKDIWGDSPDNIWATGFADSSGIRIGMIFHYDGAGWDRVNFGFNRTTLMRIKRGKKTGNQYYIWGIRENDSRIDTSKIFSFNGEKLNEIYSEEYTKSGQCFIQEINDYIYMVKGNTLSRINEDGNFEIITNITDNNFGLQFFGRNCKDIFLRMENGFSHFDGTNIEYILNTGPDEYVRESYIIRNDIFITTNIFGQGISIIYHGKLN